jgi:hypothetical protein
VAHGGGRGQAIGHGGANAPGVAHGGGKGAARGGGFGFGHAGLGNPTLSSHSQNTSHKGETHDGRSFSNHAQDHTDHSKKADQVVQVDDRGPGKEKGFFDSLPPGQEQQADRGMTLNPATIHSDPDDIVTLGLSPSQEVQPDRGLTLNLETIHSDLDDVVSRGLKPGQELQADSGGALNPSTIQSDQDAIVTLRLPPTQELQADRRRTLTRETIRSDPDDIVTRGLAPSLELNLGRGKSLPASWQAKVALGTSVPGTDATSAIVPPDRWDLGDDLTKMLLSINPRLGVNPGLRDNVDAEAWWKLPWGIALIPLVPCFGALLLFVSGIVKSGLTGQRIRKREQRKPSDARPPALDKFTEAFLIIRERQQKAVDEKTRGLLVHLSGDPNVEKARAEIEHAQEIDQTSRKDFNGIGLS